VDVPPGNALLPHPKSDSLVVIHPYESDPQVFFRATLAFFVSLILAPSAWSESAVPITAINYSNLPVYATALTLDHDAICSKLGVKPGYPMAPKSRWQTLVTKRAFEESGVSLGPTQRRYAHRPRLAR
jgi:hypothetical protein